VGSRRGVRVAAALVVLACAACSGTHARSEPVVPVTTSTSPPVLPLPRAYAKFVGSGADYDGSACRRWILTVDAHGVPHKVFVKHYPPGVFYIQDNAGGVSC
jgi:hypothetical protein